MVEPTPKYKIGDPVYLKTDPDQFERMILGHVIRSTGITYIVGFSSMGELVVEDIELSPSKNTNLLMGINS